MMCVELRLIKHTRLDTYKINIQDNGREIWYKLKIFLINKKFYSFYVKSVTCLRLSTSSFHIFWKLEQIKHTKN